MPSSWKNGSYKARLEVFLYADFCRYAWYCVGVNVFCKVVKIDEYRKPIHFDISQTNLGESVHLGDLIL